MGDQKPSGRQTTEWPSVETREGPELREMLRRFGESQWWPPQRLRASQFSLLGALLAHAKAHVPHYAERLKPLEIPADGVLTEALWRQIPILKRSEVRDLGDRLRADAYPESLGALGMTMTGGSTGIPVRVLRTDMDSFLWNAITLREELWHREDIRGTIATLRGVDNDFFAAAMRRPGAVRIGGGVILPQWGPPATSLWQTGKMAILQPGATPVAQADFLAAVHPDYLLIKPSGLRLLLAYLRDTGTALPPLRAVWTAHEVVDASLRAECQSLLGCRIVSNYSASETGYIALQCPEHAHYHVMAETLYVEVVDEAGQPCAPGEIGRVLVTPLYGFAMPLLRYEIGDEAVAGPPCPCGRGLPVLTRVVGRLENYLILKDGTRRRVDLGHYQLSAIPAIREFQLVQPARGRVELRLAVARPLGEAEMIFLRDMMQRSFGEELEHAIVIVSELPRTPGGKVMQFVSEID